MTLPSETAQRGKPRFASLTAGLLARKGEAVPAAAGFTAEAMAQHLPALEARQSAAEDRFVDPDEAEQARKARAEEPVYIRDGRPPEPRHPEPRPAEPSPAEPPKHPLEPRGSERVSALVEDDIDARAIARLGGGPPRSISARAPKPVVQPAPVEPEIPAALPAQVRADPEPAPHAPAASSSEEACPIRALFVAEACADKGVDLAEVVAKAKRAAITLRLDPQRYVRLKVASAQLRRTSQDILTEALDRYMRTMDPAVVAPCACLKDEI